ncbi:MAG: TonB-dependent receptor [Porticoccaceae bacterium]
MAVQANTLTRGATLKGVAALGLAWTLAPAAAQATEAQPATRLEEVVVTARRLSEASAAIGTDQASNTISITRDALLSAPAGVSGLKVLESLPGFNVQANDALGLYEFGNSVSVRAFNYQQIGFVLDGAPTGRSDQFGGSPIYRYVENENLGRVTASQGAGDVSLPSYASLGPIVQYFTIDPSEEFGATVSVTGGSDQLERTFVRLNTGEHNGFSAYISRSHFTADQWRGPGDIEREHYEGKVRWRGDSGAEVALTVTYNDYFDYDTPYVTQAQYKGAAGDPFGRRGRYFPYLGQVPDLPETVPGVRYSSTDHNQYYQQAINSREDTLVNLFGRLPVSDGFRLEGNVYYEDKDGYGVSPEAYATSIANHDAQVAAGLTDLHAPLGLQYGLSTVGGDRTGAVGRAVLEVGSHILSAGAWIERDEYHRTQARYNQEGGNPAGRPRLDQPVHLQRDFVSTRDTLQLFVEDQISLFNDRLNITLGVKALSIDYEIDGYRNPGDYNSFRQPRISDDWEDLLLPNVGAVWNLTPTEQLFASYAENLALPRGADDIFSQASPLAPGPDAETAENLEIGLRTNRPTFNAALALYLTRFDNRLQSFSSLVPGSTTTETFYQNVGEVRAYGAEFSGVWKPGVFNDYAYFSTNVSYNVSEFEDDYGTFAIAGNTVPDSPEWVVQAGVTVEPLPWLVANLSARYISERYGNFVNSEKVGSHTLWNAYVDIGDGFSAGPFKSARLRINVDNITDEDYLGFINGGGVPSGAAFYRPGPPRTVQVTLSADF